MYTFHLLRLSLATLAASLYALALAQSRPGLHESLFVFVALMLAAANGVATVAAAREDLRGLGFSYMLYPTNLYGALLGLVWFTAESDMKSLAGLPAGLLCLVVGPLWFVPSFRRLPEFEHPAFTRGANQAGVFFLVMAALTVGILLWAMG